VVETRIVPSPSQIEEAREMLDSLAKQVARLSMAATLLCNHVTEKHTLSEINKTTTAIEAEMKELRGWLKTVELGRYRLDKRLKGKY